MLTKEAQQALAKVLPLLCRSDFQATECTLRATSGEAITPQLRDEMLAKCEASEYVELDMTILAFEQKAGVPNRKFVRFRDGLMTRLGASGKGTPYLRDHDQQSLFARGGTVTKSTTEKLGEGHYALRQEVRLTAPWMVEMALRGLLSGSSIGWFPTGDVHCTACKAPIYTKCYHWPGDRVSESQAADGSKQYVRDRAGTLTVEWEYQDATLIETSSVNVPAVPQAGVEDVRAALAAVMPALALGDGIALAETPVPVAAAAATESGSQPTVPPKEPAMSTNSAPTNEPKPEPTLSKAEMEAEIDRRAEERFKLRTTNIGVVREFATRLGLTLDQVAVEKIVDANPDIKDAKLALVDLKAKNQSTINATHVEPGVDEFDKRKSAMGQVLTYRLMLAAGIPSLIERAKKDNPHFEMKDSLRLPNLDGDETLQRMRRARLSEMVSECLSRRGVDVRNRDEVEIAEIALSRLSGTADFPLLLADAANKILLAPFEIRQSPWRYFVRSVTLRNFQPMKMLRRSSAPKMRKLKGEDAEIKYGGYSERGENIELDTFVGGVMFTRRNMVNDDLGAFATGVLGLGDSVNDNRDDVVNNIITGDDLLSDGFPLIDDTNHKNVVATTGVGIDAIEAAEDLLSSQVEVLRTGETKQLNLDIDTWYACRKDAVAIDKLVNPNFVANEAANGLGSMSLRKAVYWDNRLKLSGTRYYYGICARRTGLVVAGLEGQTGARFSSAIDFETEGMKIKAVDDFQAGVDSWEWIVRVQR